MCAGKYLNVLRTCGKSVQHPLDSTQIIDYDQHGAYLSSIHAYYRRASAALLDMMLNDFKLVTWLNSIKHFFFLDKVPRAAFTLPSTLYITCHVS